MPTSEIAVLIPTVDRPDRLAEVVKNVHETTASPHRVYLVMESHDRASIEAAIPLDATNVTGDYGSFAKAANAGYAVSREPFLTVSNDDCRFTAGWDTTALALMSGTTHIVGLNDGSGDCKCFQLIRRSFIAEHSGVFDRPDTLLHDGYWHLCCDTELAHYAMLRGAWASAHDAVCEHRHWRFGKADRNDPGYLKGLETNAADLAEYARRRELWDPEHATPDCVGY